MRKYIMELIGTFFLVFAIGFSANPLAIGLTLMIMVYAGGHISGAHYNPAVTLGVMLRGGITTAEAVPYWIFQIAGGLLAALVHNVLTGGTFGPAPGEGVSFGTATILEIIGTFALVYVVLVTATSEKMKGNYIYGLAIGLTVTAMAFSIGDFSGCAINPAVAIGPSIMKMINGAGGMENLLIYIIGPLVGGALAATAFKYIEAE